MHRLDRFLVCPVALILGMVAGSGNASAASRESEPAIAQEPSDESLTAAEYIQLGLAAPDREWTGVDMAKAQEVFTALAQQGARKLPRYKSERSGAVFARITSPQNLKIFRDKSMPLNVRLPQALSYYQASNGILKLYLSAFVEKDARDSELVEMLGSQLRSTVVLIGLLDELLPTIKKDDPKYQVRMQGLEQTKRGLASIVAGCLQTLTERDSYRASELLRLLGYMQETFPSIVPHLTAESRMETMARLEQMQQDPALKDLKGGLQKLQVKVKAALEPGKAP